MLTLENLRYRYSRKEPDILKGINYSFEAGKKYAVMGPSGSGKTTLLSIMAKLDNPTAGSVLLNNRDIRGINDNIYRSKHVSVIFQQYHLLNNHSALDNVLLVLHLIRHSGNLHRRAADLLNEVNLPPEKHKKATRYLSGGEQQRVAIARAMAAGSSIVLADEPTGNLDAGNTGNVMALFDTLKTKYGKCVIFVTHDAGIAAQADEKLFL
jgi:putative ABC transport system ATP-binding protein